MAYQAPELTTAVVLVGGYSPPLLSQPLTLCRPERISGALSADLPLSAISLDLNAAGGIESDHLLAGLGALPDLQLTLAARGRMVEAAQVYRPPPLSIPAVLAGPYRVWPLPVPVTLCQGDGVLPDAVGTLTAALGAIPILPLGFVASGSQDLALPDAVGPSARVRQSASVEVSWRLRADQTQMGRLERRMSAADTQADPLPSGLQVHSRSMATARSFAALLAADGIRLQAGTSVSHAEATRHRDAVRLRETDAVRIRAYATVRHADQIRPRNRLASRERSAVQRLTRLGIKQRTAHPTAHRLGIRQTEAKRPDPGRWWPRYEAPPLTLRLCCLGPIPVLGTPVVLTWEYPAWPRCPGVTPEPQPAIIVPIRRVYFVQNTVLLSRVSDGADVPASDLSLELSADSWAWSWSAKIPGYALDLIRTDGEPVELLATINGHGIRLRIDRLGRSREFGSSQLAVSGRGRAAMLASPVAPTVSRYGASDSTARALLDAALTDNGVPIGWTLDWRIEDWAVPAGHWSHTGTYIEAAIRIAEAGGGYVQGHDTDPVLRILPWYPSAPWEWASLTPDIQLPEDACKTEGIEWSEKAGYNAVWVTGDIRRDHVKRAGSAGDLHAQTIVDALATDTVMTRQRGRRVLADTGRQALISITAPILPELGIVKPGQLVRYTEQGQTHIGISRSVSIACGFPTVWQTLTVETNP